MGVVPASNALAGDAKLLNHAEHLERLTGWTNLRFDPFLLELCVIAMLCPDLSLERVYVVQHALVGASEKIEDNQPTNTREEGQESEPSGTPLAPGKPEHNKRSEDPKQERRHK